MRLTPVIGAQQNGSRTFPHPELEPIYTALAQQWETTGRLIPGQPDQEWAILTRRYPWPTG